MLTCRTVDLGLRLLVLLILLPLTCLLGTSCFYFPVKIFIFAECYTDSSVVVANIKREHDNNRNRMRVKKNALMRQSGDKVTKKGGKPGCQWQQKGKALWDLPASFLRLSSFSFFKSEDSFLIIWSFL